MDRETMNRLMQEKAEAVQAVVSFIKEPKDALTYAVDMTEKQGGKSLSAPNLDEELSACLDELCRSADIRRIPSTELREHLNGFHTGLTSVDWGIAETGTLVLDSTIEAVRLTTMLCETHVALLRASDIRPDGEALLSDIDTLFKEGPRYLAYITGASRTADIERVLTIGVHGPQELHILILEEA